MATADKNGDCRNNLSNSKQKNSKMKRILQRFYPLTRKYSHNQPNEPDPEKLNYVINFDSNKDIVENYVGSLMIIGINMPEQKNFLTESALDNMIESFKRFYSNDNVVAGILHGLHGNFCTGLESSESALKKGDELLQIIHEGQKPVIASLSGSTTQFGSNLAIMCDMRVMGKNSSISLGRKGARAPIPPLVLKKISQILPLPLATEFCLPNSTFFANKCELIGLSNRTASEGSSLGVAVCWGLSIGLSPLKEVIDLRSNILSAYKT